MTQLTHPTVANSTKTSSWTVLPWAVSVCTLSLSPCPCCLVPVALSLSPSPCHLLPVTVLSSHYCLCSLFPRKRLRSHQTVQLPRVHLFKKQQKKKTKQKCIRSLHLAAHMALAASSVTAFIHVRCGVKVSPARCQKWCH